MSDQIIFDVDGLIEAQIRQRDKDYAKVCCQNLLNYAYGKGLLCDNPCDNEGNLIMPSIIKESSFPSTCQRYNEETDSQEPDL
mgnify:CR=1 FL=1